MSLIQRLRTLVVATLLAALVAAGLLHVDATRDAIEAQLQAANAEAARALATGVTGAGTAATLAERLKGVAGARVVPTDGHASAAPRSEAAPSGAPAWFVRLWPIESVPGIATLSVEGRAVATLEVAADPGDSYRLLWRGAVETAAWLTVVALVLVAAAFAALGVLREPLAALQGQAQAVAEGRLRSVDVPVVQELQPLAAALNTVAQRTRDAFEAQAAQLDALRHQAQCDPATGLPHRQVFVERLAALLAREDGVAGGSLVLVRLADLAGLNRTLGRDSADRAVRVIAEVVQAYPARVADCLVARLNGSDLALLLPAPGIAAETAASIAAALAPALAGIGRQVHVHVGAVEFGPGGSAGDLLAAADLALARAEAQGPFAVEVVTSHAAANDGERAWAAQVSQALAQRRAVLGEFALRDAQQRTLHLDCPLRLQLAADGPFEAAARWLPLAQRSGLVPEADLCALSLALEAIGRDGRARAVHVALASLADADFAARVQQRLGDRPPPPGLLWLDVPERAALDQFDLLQRFARRLRPLGVRVGLEHAGLQLAGIERLYELGVDHVKLDASLCAGIHGSDAARRVVGATVALLRPLSIRALAEGVADDRDAQTLFALGVEAVGGPWARDGG